MAWGRRSLSHRQGNRVPQAASSWTLVDVMLLHASAILPLAPWRGDQQQGACRRSRAEAGLRCRYLGSLAGKGALVAGTCWALWHLVTRRSGAVGGAAASNWPDTGPAMKGAEVRCSIEACTVRCIARIS